MRQLASTGVTIDNVGGNGRTQIQGDKYAYANKLVTHFFSP